MRVQETVVDYNHVPDHHKAIHERLENWRRWVIVRPHGWQTAPMFRMYQSKARQWEAPVIQNPVNTLDAVLVEKAVAAPAAAPKDLPIRSQAYLRLVAQLPCKHCGIWGHSHAAHANTGKGMGTKACDLQTFPLCADRPGQRGCHSLFDQGALFGKEARRLIEPAWVVDTQRRIHAMGAWPKKFPAINFEVQGGAR